MRRLFAALVALLTLTACATPDSIGWGPVELSVDERGHLVVTLGVSFETPIGDFKLGVGIDTVDHAEEDAWYVVVRRTINGVQKEMAYKLKPDAGLKVESNGRLVTEYRSHRVLIEVPPGTPTTIHLAGTAEQTGQTPQVLTGKLVGTWTGYLPASKAEDFRAAGGSTVTLRLWQGELYRPVGSGSFPGWGCTTFFILKGAYQDGKAVQLRRYTISGGDRCDFTQDVSLSLTGGGRLRMTGEGDEKGVLLRRQ